MKMALSIRQADILAYRKVAKAYFGMLDVLCHNHTAFLAGCDTSTFSSVVSSLDAGLRCLDVAISSQCAAAIDNLVGFYFKAMNTGDPPTAAAQVGFSLAEGKSSGSLLPILHFVPFAHAGCIGVSGNVRAFAKSPKGFSNVVDESF